MTIAPSEVQTLNDWGFDAGFEAIWQELGAHGVPGRIIADHGEIFTVAIEHQNQVVSRPAVPAGRLRHQVQRREDWPGVGDFVVLEAGDGMLRIMATISRRTALMRKNPGAVTEAQLMVANVDTVFILLSMNQPTNQSRLERSLAIVWDSGANPVVILTKKDLADNPEKLMEDASETAIGVPVLAVSVIDGEGLQDIDVFLTPGRTVALLGPSGVGKSTLINYWMGAERQRVSTIREDDGRGRHTTTHREMFRVPTGALVVDIPGIREVGLWDGGTSSVFQDIEEVAEHCRFTDCQHDDEPGCAVSEAVAMGRLDPDRLEQYRKMERELQHLERKRSARARSEARQVWKQRAKDARQRQRGNRPGG